MSRVRIVWKEGMTTFVGSGAIRRIHKLAAIYGLAIKPPDKLSWTQATKWQTLLRTNGLINLNMQLFVYREPRQINTKNSRYKQALQTLRVKTNVPPRRPRIMPYQKHKQTSRTVILLEQELLRKADD